MEIKIKSQVENPLLSRKELVAEISFDKSTPSNAEVKAAIAKEAKADESLVAVKNIFTAVGSKTAVVSAYHYMNKEDMAKIEPRIKVKKTAEAKAAEKAAAKEAAAKK